MADATYIKTIYRYDSLRSVVGARSRYFARGRGRCVQEYNQIWATEDPEGTAWCEARHGFSVRIFVPVRRTVCVRSAQSRSSGPKSLVSLGSVVLLQRALIWILRAMEVEAHAIRQNGWIPGCGAESRTSKRGPSVFIRRIFIRRRARTRSIRIPTFKNLLPRICQREFSQF